MPVPLPAWMPELARRRFSFSPAISGIEPNEWTLDRVAWDDVTVRNSVTQEELSIPRRFFGDVTRLDEPVRVVALLKKLEYVDGWVRPRNRAVITMPEPSGAPRIRMDQGGEVVAIRDTSAAPPRWRRTFRTVVALGCLACFIAVYVFREARTARLRRIPLRPAPLVPHSPESAFPALPERR